MRVEFHPKSKGYGSRRKKGRKLPAHVVLSESPSRSPSWPPRRPLSPRSAAPIVLGHIGVQGPSECRAAPLPGQVQSVSPRNRAALPVGQLAAALGSRTRNSLDQEDESQWLGVTCGHCQVPCDAAAAGSHSGDSFRYCDDASDRGRCDSRGVDISVPQASTLDGPPPLQGEAERLISRCLTHERPVALIQASVAVLDASLKSLGHEFPAGESSRSDKIRRMLQLTDELRRRCAECD